MNPTIDRQETCPCTFSLVLTGYNYKLKIPKAIPTCTPRPPPLHITLIISQHQLGSHFPKALEELYLAVKFSISGISIDPTSHAANPRPVSNCSLPFMPTSMPLISDKSTFLLCHSLIQAFRASCFNDYNGLQVGTPHPRGSLHSGAVIFLKKKIGL